MEDLFLKTFTPESTVFECAEWQSRKHGLPVIEDRNCPLGQVIMIFPQTKSTLQPGIYVHPSAKRITLRENTASQPMFDPTVKK